SPAEALNRRKRQCQAEKEMGFRRPCLFSWEELLNTLLAGTECADQRNLREIVLVQTGNVLLVRAGYRLLRLHDLDCVSDTRIEAVPRLRQGLVGQIDVAPRGLDLLRGRFKVEHRRAHVGLDLSAQIVKPLA